MLRRHLAIGAVALGNHGVRGEAKQRRHQGGGRDGSGLAQVTDDEELRALRDLLSSDGGTSGERCASLSVGQSVSDVDRSSAPSNLECLQSKSGRLRELREVVVDAHVENPHRYAVCDGLRVEAKGFVKCGPQFRGNPWR